MNNAKKVTSQRCGLQHTSKSYHKVNTFHYTIITDGSDIVMKKYEIKFLAKNSNSDRDLANIINTWAEDGYVLHSIIPYLDEGTTKGYTVILELSIIEH